MPSPVAKPPVSHVTAVPDNDPSFLNTVHSVKEGESDPTTVGADMGDLDGAKEGAMPDSTKGTKEGPAMGTGKGATTGLTTGTRKCTTMGTKEGTTIGSMTGSTIGTQEGVTTGQRKGTSKGTKLGMSAFFEEHKKQLWKSIKNQFVRKSTSSADSITTACTTSDSNLDSAVSLSTTSALQK